MIKKILKKIFRQADIYAVHPQLFLKRIYFSLERNLFHHNKVMVKPFYVKINTGYICNLKCPLCPTGRRENGPTGNLSVENIQQIIPKIKGIPIVSLFGWGEPFLNKDIFNIIDILNKKGFRVQINSNLNIKDEKIIEHIIPAPLIFYLYRLMGLIKSLMCLIDTTEILILHSVTCCCFKKHGGRKELNGNIFYIKKIIN